MTSFMDQKQGVIVTDLAAGRKGDGDWAPALSAWRAFVETHPDASFFHRPEWRETIGDYFGYDAYYRCAWARGADGQPGRLVGILPLFHVCTPIFGASLISTAFFVEGGIVAENDAARDALMEDAVALGARLGVKHVELRSEKAALDGWATKDDVYAVFRKDMDPDPDARLKQIPRKKRADVRKGIKAAPVVTVDAPVEDFYRLYSESLRNLGTPVHALDWYARIREDFGDAVEISTVNGPEGPVSALMSFYHKDRVLPYYGGASPAARRLHAYDYMYWAQMERAVDRGASVFDFGRSKTGTGAFDYKAYWGFEPTPLAYQYHLYDGAEMPDMNPNSPKYRRFVENWRKLPLWASNRIGPWFARQLA